VGKIACRNHQAFCEAFRDFAHAVRRDSVGIALDLTKKIQPPSGRNAHSTNHFRFEIG
jgi:hypothetical protein